MMSTEERQRRCKSTDLDFVSSRTLRDAVKVILRGCHNRVATSATSTATRRGSERRLPAAHAAG